MYPHVPQYPTEYVNSTTVISGRPTTDLAESVTEQLMLVFTVIQRVFKFVA